jgi:hypothetical protein
MMFVAMPNMDLSRVSPVDPEWPSETLQNGAVLLELGRRVNTNQMVSLSTAQVLSESWHL